MTLPQLDTAAEEKPVVPESEIRAALEHILTSEEFAASPRLREFLSYIVGEAVAGRASQIRGKTIAADVYGRDLAGGSAHDIVRVEARRLRRLLAEYYEGSGKDEDLQIRVETGGYVPHFQVSVQRAQAGETLAQVPPAKFPRGRLPTALAFFLATIVLVSVGALVLDRRERADSTQATNERTIRAALRERSMQSLQSVNLAEQARGMLFPLFDVKRQELALEMFRHVIALEPGLPDGYAGAAQVLATLALVTSNETIAAGYQSEALEMSAKALDLAPAGAWAHAASAWTRAVGGDLETALKHASIARDLAPTDGYVLDLVGMTAILARDPAMALDASSPNRLRSGKGRFGARNIWGVSQYMLGNYRAAVEAFSGAPEAGAPISAPTLIFLAASYDHLGDEISARRYVEELASTWPDFPTALLLRRIFSDSPIVRDILTRLKRNGRVKM